MTNIRILIAIVLFVLVIGSAIFLLNRPRTPGQTERVPQSSGSTRLSPLPANQGLLEQMTPEEKTYPTAPPQQFDQPSEEVGGLVVTTNPSQARVLVDAVDAEGEAPVISPQVTPPPTKLTPFTMTNIPVGAHRLSIFKKGYLEKTVPFEIKVDEITRIDIELKPSKDAYQ
ncbi:hypothetical protein A2631_05220 [Candidatus Daviesbacteria bacterium RIFCSPHIGHO2_01_FULL_44_29]|uniref:PEGA domain-containing protein n=1 Tax=Candidatus Daviesbacteria bacterium RIFCSPHIGHO2_02_FULL_43_12 TaxID=1797776 RepID=A0A1F5KH30_9BACT|nr:MAG: hypothetical protein A2631_05220 [Candidatus Daviesbacteria bacterium RIFCSPHIGHO2_01_FULL_44_29]OGE40120.1 MAG: hypothetical protein A3D25_04940 [Candidatus Daviesbacteria bacterium RIFCSPHIGHO2_02_FULL_43_12]OGE41069.1 MAG: hypothetical protein A3E86_05045 [Candidatus Daviesbacteria bacterium RIFCSPHIGHO2_12_FULL_47_45]OGE70199.1 MAG: hypothetical protein A3B55_00620 [Candidatus Daviesbacteria bacterium RIFCSPLOWO2_01_FULL_43_15]